MADGNFQLSCFWAGNIFLDTFGPKNQNLVFFTTVCDVCEMNRNVGWKQWMIKKMKTFLLYIIITRNISNDLVDYFQININEKLIIIF